jgi:hypothetical protein
MHGADAAAAEDGKTDHHRVFLVGRLAASAAFAAEIA